MAALSLGPASRAQVVGDVTPAPTPGLDVMRDLQLENTKSFDQELDRVYAFGWHGLKGRFTSHQTHSNRPVPAVLFGASAGLDSISGAQSPYRSEASLRQIYGAAVPRTVNVEHAYGDQSQLHGLLKQAADRGAKRIVVLLLDGADWQTYAATAVATRRSYDKAGFAHDLSFFQYQPQSSAPGGQGAVLRSMCALVTSPVGGPVAPGFDLARGGVTPWAAQDAVYLAGDYKLGGYEAMRVHKVADSAATATAISTGHKTRNLRIGMDRNGKALLPLGRELQARGWTVATVTDVPFSHASPASFYASVDDRNKYIEIGRQMLGFDVFAGVDIVMGYGFAHSEKYLRDADLTALRAAKRYRVVTSGDAADARVALMQAAQQVGESRRLATRDHRRLFGCFGDAKLNHAPYRTANGQYDPVSSMLDGKPVAAETYDAAQRARMPTLREMTLAAIHVIDATPERPAMLFVEAGMIDWAAHANNLDNIVGEVLSAEETFRTLADWIQRTAGWEQSLLLVTSDHGHLLQVDFEALKKRTQG